MLILSFGMCHEENFPLMAFFLVVQVNKSNYWHDACLSVPAPIRPSIQSKQVFFKCPVTIFEYFVCIKNIISDEK